MRRSLPVVVAVLVGLAAVALIVVLKSSTVPGIRIVGVGQLQQRDGEPMEMCIGAIPLSHGAPCGLTVRVVGVSWRQVQHPFDYGDIIVGSATLTGTLRDRTFVVETVEPVREIPDVDVTRSRGLGAPTLPVPTEDQIEAVAALLVAKTHDVHEPGLVITGVGWGLEIDGHPGIEVTVLAASDRVVRRIAELVGPEVAPWTRVDSEFQVID